MTLPAETRAEIKLALKSIGDALALGVPAHGRLHLYKAEDRLRCLLQQETAPEHNPDNLTTDQVGVGYRLLHTDELDGRFADQAQLWCLGEWINAPDADCPKTTYRIAAQPQ